MWSKSAMRVRRNDGLVGTREARPTHEKLYGGRPWKVRPPYHPVVPYAKLELLLSRAGRVFRRDADDLPPGTAGDVHRVDHLSVLHLRVTLPEDDLLGPAVVDLLEPGSEAILGDLLGVDGVAEKKNKLEQDMNEDKVHRS